VSDRVSDEDWSGVRASSLSILARPGARAWWAENVDRFNPRFAQWVADGVASLSS
jgi:hypothetical protein